MSVEKLYCCPIQHRMTTCHVLAECTEPSADPEEEEARRRFCMCYESDRAREETQPMKTEMTHDHYKYVVAVSTPGGRLAFMCDYCGEVLQVGRVANEKDEDWEDFHARPRRKKDQTNKLIAADEQPF